MDISSSLVAAFVGILTVVLCGYLYRRSRRPARLKAPRGVVILYQIGRGPRAPSVSPFPMKLETFLRMHNIPYMNDHSGQFSKKGKTPWIELDGRAIADSQLAIEYMKTAFRLPAEAHLTLEQRAAARGFLKLTEENLYWTMCIDFFGGDLQEARRLFPYTGLKLWMTLTLLRLVIKLETWGHGIGRHSSEEVWDIAVKDMTALSDFLGTKPFLMGEEPSEVDCAVFGMLAQIYWHMQGQRHQVYMKENLPNLVDYTVRMKTKYWPDWDTITLEGANYTNDHGKLYCPEKVGTNENGNISEKVGTNDNGNFPEQVGANDNVSFSGPVGYGNNS
ncbi:failed axon connections homolog isoform X1 [Mya arenaria]|uniref:failed axon connections homolog isoform X1 n=1 Tax=Mya arenaria TaxID=6604 RepID=UPI0022E2B9AC|nr:failed axon connections homolog isoform X1 [Mya arenaria]